MYLILSGLAPTACLLLAPLLLARAAPTPGGEHHEHEHAPAIAEEHHPEPAHYQVRSIDAASAAESWTSGASSKTIAPEFIAVKMEKREPEAESNVVLHQRKKRWGGGPNGCCGQGGW